MYKMFQKFEQILVEFLNYESVSKFFVAQFAGVVEYTDPAPNECPGYDSKQSDGEVPVTLGFLGNTEHPFIAIAPKSTLARRGSTWKGPIYGLDRTNSILLLNWIVWLNWIAWNRNILDN